MSHPAPIGAIRFPQFSLRHLLGLMAGVGASLALARYANALLAAGLWAAILALFVLSVLLAVYRRDEQRAFCGGWALAIGLATAIASPWNGSVSQSPLNVQNQLANEFSEVAHLAIWGEEERVYYRNSRGQSSSKLGPPPGNVGFVPLLDSFRRVNQALFVVWFGYLGGWMGWLAFRTSRAAPASD